MKTKFILALLVFLSGLFLGLAMPNSLNIDTLQALDWIVEARDTHQKGGGRYHSNHGEHR